MEVMESSFHKQPTGSFFIDFMGGQAWSYVWLKLPLPTVMSYKSHVWFCLLAPSALFTYFFYSTCLTLSIKLNPAEKTLKNKVCLQINKSD